MNGGDPGSDDGVTLTPWSLVQVAAVVVVLGLFLWATSAVLNPLLLFAILWAVLMPFRGQPGHRALVVVAATLTGLWLLAETGGLLAPFILAAVLAYILDPLVDRMGRLGLSRSLAILLIIVVALGALAALLLLAVPAAFRELGELVDSAPLLFERLGAWLEAAQARLRGLDIPLFDGDQIAERLEQIDGEEVVAFLQERREALLASLWGGILGLGRGIGSIGTVLSYVVLTPVLTFYLIRDFDQITGRVARLVPQPRRPQFVAFFRECDGIVSSYLRGQLLVASVIGLLTGVGLGIAQFPYALSIGLMVGVFSIVPYLGLLLSLVPAIFIALVSGSVLLSLLKIAVVFGVTQVLDGTVITPRIVGDSVGIHPVWVLLALSVGGYFFGVAGLLVGVPAAAVTKLLIQRGLARYEASDLYRGVETPPAP
jgi:predicted PurR-regulated permease PerM